MRDHLPEPSRPSSPRSRGGSSLIPFLLAWWPALVGAAALACYVLVYATGLASPPIRSDGWAYYVYLPAVLIYHDPSLSTLARECCGGMFPATRAALHWPTGWWLSETPMGVAVLMAPFFVVADALTWWSNLPRDGFSPYYQHAAGLAGLCYFVAGVWRLRHVLAAYWSDGVVLATLVCVTFGTNLFHYATFDSTFSHAYSFCLCVLLIDLVPAWFRSPTGRRSLALGCVVGLIVLVRHPNVILPVGMAFYGVHSRHTLLARTRWVLTHGAAVATVLGVAAAWVVPQLWLDHLATGHWLVNTYGPGQGFNFASPKVWAVFFSPAKGLFVWSPMLGLAVVGFGLLRGPARDFLLPIAVVLALQTYAIASWWSWQFGDSFGHRGFTDALPLFALGLAACFDAARRRRIVPIVAVVASLFVVLSVAQMTQYWLGALPTRDATWSLYWATFLRFSS